MHEVEQTRYQIIKQAAQAGNIGYLSGYRYWDNDTQPVMVFFKEKPPLTEIERRRSNGLKAAQWHWINRKVKEATK